MPEPQENSPASGELFSYQPEEQDWKGVIGLADRILAGGSSRDNGIADREWGSDLLGLEFSLARVPAGTEDAGYLLSYWPQFADPDDGSGIGFSKEFGVDTLTGPIVEELSGQSADACIEEAEMKLRLYLQTASID